MILILCGFSVAVYLNFKKFIEKVSSIMLLYLKNKGKMKHFKRSNLVS